MTNDTTPTDLQRARQRLGNRHITSLSAHESLEHAAHLIDEMALWFMTLSDRGQREDGMDADLIELAALIHQCRYETGKEMPA